MIEKLKKIWKILLSEDNTPNNTQDAQPKKVIHEHQLQLLEQIYETLQRMYRVDFTHELLLNREEAEVRRRLIVNHPYSVSFTQKTPWVINVGSGSVRLTSKHGELSFNHNDLARLYKNLEAIDPAQIKVP